tara:strand:+ start:1263 stop:1508 length:246 start_codon:yes stop_codon:yes gene_type:complete
MNKIYHLNKHVFFNHYFKSESKEKIAAFISPYILNLVNKDVHFSLQDLLEDSKTIPSYLLSDYPKSSKPNQEIDVNFIKLV